MKLLKKNKFVSLTIFCLVLMSLFIIYLVARVNSLDYLLHSNNLERVYKMGYPRIDDDVLFKSSYNTCVDASYGSYQSLLEEGQAPTYELRLFVKSGVNWRNLAYELNQVDGITLGDIVEEQGFVNVVIDDRNILKNYAHWICFFKEQEFVTNAYYGVGEINNRNYIVE